MEWTTEWPTKAGWYWMLDDNDEGPEIVYYSTLRGIIDCTGSRVSADIHGHPFEFYGPIAPPASKSAQNA